MSTTNDLKQPDRQSWTDGLVFFTERTFIVIGGFSIVIGFFYSTFVKTPIEDLTHRIDKLEQQVQQTNEYFVEVKQQIILIGDRQTQVRADIKDIKEMLKREGR